MKKAVFFVLLAAAMLTYFSIPVKSDAKVEETVVDAEPIIEGYSDIGTARCSISVSGGTANVSAIVSSSTSDTTSCAISLEIQEKFGFIWITKETWTESAAGGYLAINESYSVTSGKTYRAKARVTVYTASGSESATVTSASQTAN